MPIDYSISKPTAVGAPRSTSPTEVEILTDVSDTIADVGSRLDTLESGSSTTELVLRSQDFGTAAGSPAVGNYPANRASGWLLDAAVSERLWTTVSIPADWTTMTLTYVWANAGAGAGDVNWVTYVGSSADGVNLGTLPATTVSTTATAGAAGVLVHTTTTAVTVPNPGGLNNVAPNRNGPAVVDTLANDCVLYAVILGKAT